jgi:aldose 1-epimerase
MKTFTWVAALVAGILAFPALGAAQPRYTVKTMGDVVQLRDERANAVVSVLTPVSNAYEMVVNGHNVIRMNNIRSVDDMRARPALNGMPLLAPFANRLDETAFYANGKKYNFDLELGNVRGPIPIHGYVTGASTWQVVEAKADANGAWVTSKLDFYRHPQYMAQFPFAHTLTMTYRLSNGTMEVRTRIDNLSNEPMPVGIGFHPYFTLPEGGRNDWTLDIGARTHWKLSPTKIPTGETQPADAFFEGDRRNVPISRFATRLIDDVFSDLDRDAQGRGKVTVSNGKQSLTVTMGPNYRTVLVYSTVPPQPNAPAGGGGGGGNANQPPPPPVSKGPAVPLSATDGPTPPTRGFVAFEPMAGITNSMNAAHKGLYKELQQVAPGGSWQESFWVSTTGF